MSFFGGRRQEQPPPAPQPQGEEKPEPPRPQPLPAPLSPQQPVGFETVLGANSVMEGTLRSSANVRLDGAFSGTLDISGNILVGETAKINADIKARNISIAGAVRGNISGKKVQLLRTGRIWGDITAQALTTEEGAFIDGKIKMMGAEAPIPEQPTPPSGTHATVVMAPAEAPAAAPESAADEVAEAEPDFAESLNEDDEKRD
ncbi:MAG: polymer-forming cytoskeletal protein [Chloroflexi bacterium]|nr:polymer-forming cytoskeletal protein [Chloroflexota bacterium]